MEFGSVRQAKEAFAKMGDSLAEARRTYQKVWPELPANKGKPTHAWFMGFAPVGNPKIALAVLVEYGDGGAKTAGPVAHDIFEAYFGGDSRKASKEYAAQG